MEHHITDKSTRRFLISKLGLFDRYNIAFIFSSIIPLAALVFVLLKYVEPVLKESENDRTFQYLTTLLFLMIFLAILGFFVSRAATREMLENFRTCNDRLSRLFELSQSLNRQLYDDVLLEDIVKSAIEMTGASAGIVLLRANDRDVLTFVVSVGTGAITVKEIPVGVGVAGWVAKENEVVLLNDLEGDPRYDDSFDILPNFDTTAILAAPLGIGSKNYGTVELLQRSGNKGFYPEDANLLKSLASQASIFIENGLYRNDQQNYVTHITEILLSSLEGTRQFWKDHLKNTARYACLIGKQLKLSDKDMKDLYFAALLHDIGFIRINKGANTRKMIEQHPELGYELIKPIHLWKDVASIIRYHHERYDGTGYPHQLKGDEIPLFSRILALAETFDTMTNPASYRLEHLQSMEAIREIRAYAGTQFDPVLVEVFESVVRFPDFQ